MGKQIHDPSEKIEKRRKKELEEVSLRARDLTKQETLREGLSFSQFVLEMNRGAEDARRAE